MRLRDDPQPPPPNPSTSQPGQPPQQQQSASSNTRTTRKRKSPPSTPTGSQPPPPPQPQHQHPLPAMHITQMLPPPHALMPPGMGHPPPPPMYQYAPPDYSQPPPPHPHPEQAQQALNGEDPDLDDSPKNGGRQLSQSKRAEQNRKAQRAFRERRDQRVKALESRSQLLDAALASADEANRRWEECRALVDQLRIENTALRAALSQSQMGGQLAQGQLLPPPQQQQQQQQGQEGRSEGEEAENPAAKE
ncbi:hypothetical protein PAXRUDRAFT_8017 [Paxillus rubicundulus Ve08.2h10]|uniref:BZIP domain-containing protein n=1 Tax=Paxillus rubicundulus Ve08.2h10 TaxID=930991 RepID=A0A0D0EAV3_9AGAM|nr:hypothetical protein PAXRUDRAFT_8017 [Paxillus rubicundulus Ve08.2h10]